MVAVLSLGIFPPLYAAMNFIDSLAQIGTVVEQITGILDVPEQRRATSPDATDGTRIELENVRFSYGREEVVHGIDLTIEPNSVTAFVGPSGSGKSTLARLIAGFWDASSGAVRIGGRLGQRYAARPAYGSRLVRRARQLPVRRYGYGKHSHGQTRRH